MLTCIVCGRQWDGEALPEEHELTELFAPDILNTEAFTFGVCSAPCLRILNRQRIENDNPLNFI